MQESTGMALFFFFPVSVGLAFFLLFKKPFAIKAVKFPVSPQYHI